MEFCRLVAITGNRHWLRINATLYTLCFAGKALAIARCEPCFASIHVTVECGLHGNADPKLPAHVKVIESAVLALTASQGKPGRPIRASAEPCRLDNDSLVVSTAFDAHMFMFALRISASVIIPQIIIATGDHRVLRLVQTPPCDREITFKVYNGDTFMKGDLETLITFLPNYHLIIMDANVAL